MKKKSRSFLTGMLALSLVFGVGLTACGGDDDGGDPTSVTYTSSSTDGTTYELTISAAAAKAVYAPKNGDSYTLKITKSGSTKTSTGTVVVNGTTFTLTATKGGTFTITVANGKMTAISGAITFDDGNTEEGPGTVTPQNGGEVTPDYGARIIEALGISGTATPLGSLTTREFYNNDGTRNRIEYQAYQLSNPLTEEYLEQLYDNDGANVPNASKRGDVFYVKNTDGTFVFVALHFCYRDGNYDERVPLNADGSPAPEAGRKYYTRYYAIPLDDENDNGGSSDVSALVETWTKQQYGATWTFTFKADKTWSCSSDDEGSKPMSGTYSYSGTTLTLSAEQGTFSGTATVSGSTLTLSSDFGKDYGGAWTKVTE